MPETTEVELALRVLPDSTIESRHETAKSRVRDVERFCYRIVALAEDSGNQKEIKEAREILRLAVGLRRRLDEWRSHG